ncbi:helix-hairpin-helix domain-containing protein [Arenibacter aquaticus]|uniref:Helix-hairpin-helix domain-containing protein n=1 Tax=Arenibacter aquaticus TaxID=2489054 RepID=A0A430K0T6_9FLAO|nr:helix-hairpin-helix domain-containing protein [Arenibacter aquaticus]RTE52586.1 helix-hairpin-helix domain-containing protein [Arenibacter aquaticus]
MNNRAPKSFLKFNKQERSGIFFLLLLIVVFQILYFVGYAYPTDNTPQIFTEDVDYQMKMEELKERNSKRDSMVIFPFNPNFISDYKGYTLGMSPGEIDRLHNFRANNKFVNSEKEFQLVTRISDSLLDKLAPYFKFPDWATDRTKTDLTATDKSEVVDTPYPIRTYESHRALSSIKIKDLNKATAQELKDIRGIGDKLSQRIVKFRDRLGGFIDERQLSHVYGLDLEVVDRVLKRYRVLNPPPISKININSSSVHDIAKLVYFKYSVAAKIVAYRQQVGAIDSFDELVNIEDFPSDKLDIIQLYLQL